MQQKNIDKLNKIEFAGLENILCGDAMYYIADAEGNVKTALKSFIRILAGLCTSGSTIIEENEGRIIFLFSNSYRDRPDFKTWYKKVMALVDSKIIVKPIPRKIDLRYLGKRYSLLMKWFHNKEIIGFNLREKLYYFSKLLFLAVELWNFQETMSGKMKQARAFITLCDVQPDDSLWVQYFNSINIDTISLQHGVIAYRGSNRWSIGGSKCRYYLVFGEYTKRQGILAGQRKEKLIKLGMPQHLESVVITKMQDLQNEKFGVILGGRSKEEDYRVLKLARRFAEKNHIYYDIKLHPGQYENKYDDYYSEYVNTVYKDDITIDDFGTQIDFVILSISTVYMEYLLKLIPVFVFYDGEGEDLYEEVMWNKIKDLESFQMLYERLKMDKEWFEKRLIETRSYFCEVGDIKKNYKTFLEQYEKME